MLIKFKEQFSVLTLFPIFGSLIRLIGSFSLLYFTGENKFLEHGQIVAVGMVFKTFIDSSRILNSALHDEKIIIQIYPKYDTMLLILACLIILLDSLIFQEFILVVIVYAFCEFLNSTIRMTYIKNQSSYLATAVEIILPISFFVVFSILSPIIAVVTYLVSLLFFAVRHVVFRRGKKISAKQLIFFTQDILSIVLNNILVLFPLAFNSPQGVATQALIVHRLMVIITNAKKIQKNHLIKIAHDLNKSIFINDYVTNFLRAVGFVVLLIATFSSVFVNNGLVVFGFGLSAISLIIGPVGLLANRSSTKLAVINLYSLILGFIFCVPVLYFSASILSLIFIRVGPELVTRCYLLFVIFRKNSKIS